MHSRTLIPVVLLLAACAEMPTSTDESLPAGAPVVQEETAPTRAGATTRPAAEIPAGAHSAASLSGPSLPSPATAPPSTPAPSAAEPQPQAAESSAAPTAKAPAPELSQNSLWRRIGKGYALQPMDNELVRDWESWYSSRPDYVARMIDRSSHFLYHIVEQVEKRGMPMEVALLPMIESAYNPVAYSRAHASGIWQFIPSTGKDFGLRQNWWYDGRRDIIAATDAALDYLEKLYGMFNDWNLALAAYNWGEGAVGRAQERNRTKGLPTDYESLTVPSETRGYVPKLIAVKNILSNPARYGLRIADIPNEPYFETLTVKRHIDVKLAAKLAEMPLEEFKFLNPGHNKPVIKAGEAQRIVLPKDKAVTFLANFEKHDKPLVSWQAVTFRAGEKAEKVAALHGMTLAELKQVSGLAHQKRIMVGQPLLVPLKTGVDDPTLPDLPATRVTLPKAFQAAKKAAQARKQGHAVNRKAGAEKAVQKGRKQPVKQLRAESGKRVKVVIAPKPSAPSRKPIVHPPQRQKVASRQ